MMQKSLTVIGAWVLRGGGRSELGSSYRLCCRSTGLTDLWASAVMTGERGNIVMDDVKVCHVAGWPLKKSNQKVSRESHVLFVSVCTAQSRREHQFVCFSSSSL